jgi:hypothetical protein
LVKVLSPCTSQAFRRDSLAVSRQGSKHSKTVSDEVFGFWSLVFGFIQVKPVDFQSRCAEK